MSTAINYWHRPMVGDEKTRRLFQLEHILFPPSISFERSSQRHHTPRPIILPARQSKQSAPIRSHDTPVVLPKDGATKLTRIDVP
ncbi:MAG: hypothetical protein EOP85_06610 [Verrucomicrobiaceae bacterium]|nr:MAG: hypothetical protein EOP85_06610 [Verrucomicrobiaceae bacterium]